MKFFLNKKKVFFIYNDKSYVIGVQNFIKINLKKKSVFKNSVHLVDFLRNFYGGKCFYTQLNH